MLVWALLGLAASYFGDRHRDGDEVPSLPGFGKTLSRQLAGFVPVTDDGKNNLFYFFVQAETYSPATPTLIWLNGGPGASSLTGMLVENLGPQKMLANGSLVLNPDRISKKYNLLAIDNPVGSGYSYTENGNYAKDEEEVRTQFVAGLRRFFDRHPEYAKHPLWMMGESYGGKYIPHISYELMTNAKEIPFQGMIIGNGLLDSAIAYPTVGELAFGAGMIDERTEAALKPRVAACLEEIHKGSPTAGAFCENQTVRWLYGADGVAGKNFFYYDIGLVGVDFDSLTNAMSKWLNSADVRAALHVGDHTWVQHDESGPVSHALQKDFTRPSLPEVAAVANAGYRVAFYNGVRDGSSCNHIGNLRSLEHMTWKGEGEFATAPTVTLMHGGNVVGNERTAGKLSYTQLLRTGHLVPTVIPEIFSWVIEGIVGKVAEEQTMVV